MVCFRFLNLFNLHFSCSKLVCCEITQSCRLAASMYRIHIHTEHSNTWTQGFSLTLPSVMMCRAANTLCVLSHSDTCCCDCFSLQRSSKTAILAGSDPHLLSCYHPLMVTFTLLETHTLLALSTLLRSSCSLSPFKFTQQSTSLPT